MLIFWKFEWLSNRQVSRSYSTRHVQPFDNVTYHPKIHILKLLSFSKKSQKIWEVNLCFFVLGYILSCPYSKATLIRHHSFLVCVILPVLILPSNFEQNMLPPSCYSRYDNRNLYLPLNFRIFLYSVAKFRDSIFF